MVFQTSAITRLAQPPKLVVEPGVEPDIQFFGLEHVPIVLFHHKINTIPYLLLLPPFLFVLSPYLSYDDLAII
jgi:hypothetical protein